MTLTRLALGALLASGLALNASAQCNPDVSTDFEFTDTSGQFVLGTAPHTVTFVGGSSISIGAPALYTSGAFAWMITPGVTATITCDTPAETLEFFVRNQSSQTNSLVTVFGTDGSVITTVVPTNTAFTPVSVSSSNPQIARVEVAHVSGTGLIAVEDLSYCANVIGDSFCFGDGGDQMGCSDCPCGNNADFESAGGCLNAAGGSAQLVALGSASVGNNLRM